MDITPAFLIIIFMNFKTLSILTLSALLCGLCACERPDEGGDGPAKVGNVTVSPEDIKVACDAVEVQLEVTSDCDWGINSDDNTWVSVSPGGGIPGKTSVKVKIAENATGESRKTALTVRYGKSKLSVPVWQNYDVVAVEIPDAAFKSCLLRAYDVDSDGVLSTKEAANVTRIEASGCGVKDMSGLAEKFPNLTYLDCSDNELVDLDLSGLVALTYLDCSDNDLSSIDIIFQNRNRLNMSSPKSILLQAMNWFGRKSSMNQLQVSLILRNGGMRRQNLAGSTMNFRHISQVERVISLLQM